MTASLTLTDIACNDCGALAGERCHTITIKTITNAQILDLQQKLLEHPAFAVSFVVQEQLRACRAALEYDPRVRDDEAANAHALNARVRCVEILRSRAIAKRARGSTPYGHQL